MPTITHIETSGLDSSAPLFVETFLIDGDGTLTYSKGFDLACFGFKPGPSSGLSVFDLFQDDPALLETIKRALNGEAINTEANMAGITYATSYSPVLDIKGKVKCVIGVSCDITERKATQKALLDRNEELIKINKELDKFVYSASHDLRAPIASLLGLIEVARLEKNMDSITRLLNMQEKSLLRLDRFIKDIVDHSRNTRLPVECESINFEKMLQMTMEQFQFMDNVNKIRTKIIVDQEEKFFTAPSRLEIVLNNLISNSLKYADMQKDDPFIEVQIKSNSRSAEIKVIDNGEGIPTDSKSRVFDMFYRATANGPGSGLGLYIVKEAVGKIGGTINVNSEYGKGTEFVVNIPNLLHQPPH